MWRALGLAGYGPEFDAELDTWQSIARNTGWFWPDEDVCVVSHRPVTPMAFADGWRVPVPG